MQGANVLDYIPPVTAEELKNRYKDGERFFNNSVLTGENLARFVAHDSKFDGADFDGADLNDTYFENVDCRGASFVNASFSGTFKRVDLRGANLHRMDLRAAYLTECVLDHETLASSDFIGSLVDGLRITGYTPPNSADELRHRYDAGERYFVGADLSHSDLAGVSLIRAKLDDTNFAEADLSDTHLDGADLRGCTLVAATLCGASLKGANLTGSDLSRADVHRANLADANLAHTNLTHADFKGAILDNAELQYAKLETAIFDLAKMDLAQFKKRGIRFGDSHAPILEVAPTPLHAIALGADEATTRLVDMLASLPAVRHVIIESSDHHTWGHLQNSDDGQGNFNTIFIDPSCLGIEEAARFIFKVRDEYPDIVFVLFTDLKLLDQNKDQIFKGPRRRLAHYFMLDKATIVAGQYEPLEEVVTKCEAWLRRECSQRHILEHIFEYDVALSFAGDDRVHAENLAKRLKENGIRVFYDSFETADLWGKNLYTHLHDVYSRKARYCVMFVSKAYADKLWTSHERESAQERALEEKGDYILPIRIDDTRIPGLPSTVAYLSIEQGIEGISALLIQKIEGVIGYSRRYRDSN